MLMCFRIEQQVLDRFELENGGDLLVGAVCLLEVSVRGLLEVELLTILGDEDNLMPRNEKQEEGKEKGKVNRNRREKQAGGSRGVEGAGGGAGGT